MALPPGIVSKSVTIGIASFTDGTLAEGTATITAPVNLVHTPTNRPIFSSQISKRFVDGEVTFDLLPTDAPGLNRVDWTYKLNVVISGALVQPEPIYFLLPTAGPDTIDLDGFVTVPSSAGIPVSVDVLTTDDFTAPESQLRTTLSQQLADETTAGTSAFALAQREASVAAVEGAATVAPTGAWDFDTAPTVNGAPLAPGGATVSDASTTTKGIVELATAGETTTGTDSTRAVTPAGLKAVVDTLAQDAATKSDLRNISAKGDSLTAGGQDGSGYTYPSFLASALGTGVSVTNAGQPGWTSTEVAIRAGAIPVVLDAFTLPAGTGATAVTVASPSGYWNANPTWSGVLDVGGTQYPGQLAHQANGSTTFARTTAGSSVSVPAGATFTATEQNPSRGHLNLIEAGRNNLNDTSAPTRVPADVAAMVASLTPTVKRYLALSVHTASQETSGSTLHTRIKAVNDALAAAHGTRYVDTRRYLIDKGLSLNGLTPTAADNTAIAADTIPPQLLESDGIHPNKYGYKAMAQAVLDRIVALGWAPDKLASMPSLPVPLPTAAVTFDITGQTAGAKINALPVTQGTGTSDQNTATKQPAVITAGGKQWASYDGVDDETNISVPLPTQPYSVVMRVKARSLAARVGLMWPNGTGNTVVILADGSVVVTGTGGTFATPAGQVVANTEVVVGVVMNGPDSLVQVGANAPVAGNPGTNAAGQGWWRLGYAFGGSDVFAALDFNKAKIYSSALTPAQLATAISSL